MKCRLCRDLIECFKIVHGLSLLDFDTFLYFRVIRTRGHMVSNLILMYFHTTVTNTHLLIELLPTKISCHLICLLYQVLVVLNIC